MADLSLKDALTILGGVLGAVAFLWKVWDALSAHVHIDIDLTPPTAREKPTALLTVENKGYIPKRLDYAVLVLGPEEDSLAAILKKLASGGVGPSELAAASNTWLRLYALRRGKAAYVDGRYGIVPVPFFFAEQPQIGNEKVKYRVLLESEQLAAGSAVVVRFVVFMRYPFKFIRWRTTAELLMLPTG